MSYTSAPGVTKTQNNCLNDLFSTTLMHFVMGKDVYMCKYQILKLFSFQSTLGFVKMCQFNDFCVFNNQIAEILLTTIILNKFSYGNIEVVLTFPTH